MKCSKSFIATVVVLLVGGGGLWHHWNDMANAPVVLPFPDAHIGDVIMNRRLGLGKPPFPTNIPAAPPAPVSSN